MTPTVCLAADTLQYANGGGHRWVYLNWALGLRAAGCEVLWLEAIPAGTSEQQLDGYERALREDLARHALEGSLVLYDERSDGAPLPGALDRPLDLLLTLRYRVPEPLLRAGRRSAMIDLDPGLTQLWICAGHLEISPHDVYFSIGEAARQPAGLPDCGIEWQYTPPCVDLGSWPVTDSPADAPYTTITHWWPADDEGWIELDGVWIENSKRAGFEPFLDVPSRTEAPLELALGGLDSDEEAQGLRALGWRVRDAWVLAATTTDYAAYIHGSKGEFSCAKPSVSRLPIGWISDRTLCYLASGKPCVVQYSGDLDLSDPDHGLLQFRTSEEAANALERVEADYSTHSRAARRLAETRFDARQVALRLLERALP